MEQPNPDKLDRETGLELLKAYMFHLADDQRRQFVDEQDYVPANKWGLFAYNVRQAESVEDMLAFVLEFAEDDPSDAAYMVLEALCSYRTDEYKHVERKLPPITPPTHSHGRVAEKKYLVMLETEVDYHILDFDGEWPCNDDMILAAMAYNHAVNMAENGYQVAYAQLIREIIRYD